MNGLTDIGAGVKVGTPKVGKAAAYVHVPVSWVRRAQEAGGASTVAVALLVWYRRSVTGDASFSVGNSVAAQFGLDRKQKAWGLQVLERSGLVAIERKPGRSPVVTLNTAPDS